MRWKRESGWIESQLVMLVMYLSNASRLHVHAPTWTDRMHHRRRAKWRARQPSDEMGDEDGIAENLWMDDRQCLRIPTIMYLSSSAFSVGVVKMVSPVQCMMLWMDVTHLSC